MAGTNVSTVVRAPAEQVWALIGDFHRLDEWHPGLPPSRPGNDLHGNAIGSVRVFEFNGVVLRETLLAYDAERRRTGRAAGAVRSSRSPRSPRSVTSPRSFRGLKASPSISKL